MVYEPKFVQISACGEPHGSIYLYALDADGNVWELSYSGGEHKWRFIGSPAGIDKP
jgi:hypothetical protein